MLGQKFIERIVVNHPLFIVVAFVGIAVISTIQLPKLESDPSPFLLAEDHPTRLGFKEFKASFTGSRARIIVLLKAKDTVFNRKTLARVRKLTEAFEKIQIVTKEDTVKLGQLAAELGGDLGAELNSILERGLDEEASFDIQDVLEKMQGDGKDRPEIENSLEEILKHLAPIIKVTSLANTDNILSVNGGLEISPIYDEVPETKEAALEIGRAVMDNDLFKGALVSKDGRYTAIYAEQALEEHDTEGQYRIYQTVLDIVEREYPGDEKFYVAGFPAVASTLGYSIREDTRRLFPAVLSIIVASLLILFRALKGVIVPILVVVISLSVTLAGQVVMGIPLNVITSGLPVFILSIGVADGVHIFSEYRDLVAGGSSKIEAVKKTMRELMWPVIMTSVTTAAAFWTLSVTEIVQLKYFGIFVAVGTLVAMVLSLVFIPALLALLPQFKAVAKKRSGRIDHFFTGLLEAVSVLAIRRARPILILSAVLMIVCAWGTSRVRVDNNALLFFPEDLPLVVASDEISEQMAGSLDLNLLIRGNSKEKEPLKRPENLKAIAELAKFFEAHPDVGKVLDITTLLRRINLVLHDGDQSYNRVPNSVETVEYKKTEEVDGETVERVHKEEVPGREIISQYLFLYENAGGDTLSDVVDIEYKKANMRVILRTNSSYEVALLLNEVRDFIAKNFPKDLEVTFTGTAGVLVRATEEIVTSQMTSLGLSTVIVFVILLVTFRSLGTGMLAMIPLAGAILINFGIMGVYEIPLDIGTAVVSSIVIGIGVDYSIHYLSRLLVGLKRGLGFEESVLHTVKLSGKAISFNALVVGIGFLALQFSMMTPLKTMGWMITLTMFISALGSIVLLPASLSLWYKRKE